MKQAVKQMRFKKLCYWIIASRCGFVRGGAWSSLAKTHLLWSCGYSRLIATFKAGFYNHLSQITQVIFWVSKKPQFICLCRRQTCKCGSRFNEENTRYSTSFLACRACYGQSGRTRVQGERADQSVQVSTSAFVYLSTGDRLGVAFCNPDAFLRRDPIWAAASWKKTLAILKQQFVLLQFSLCVIPVKECWCCVGSVP